MARSTSLSEIGATPRTPTRSRLSRFDSTESVELSLLDQEEGHSSGPRPQNDTTSDGKKKALSNQDRKSMILLCVLCQF